MSDSSVNAQDMLLDMYRKKVTRLLKGEASLNRRYAKLLRQKKHLEFQLEKAKEKRERTQWYIKHKREYIYQLKGTILTTQMALSNLSLDACKEATTGYIEMILKILEGYNVRFKPRTEETKETTEGTGTEKR